MAFNNIDSLNLGKILHIVFDNEMFNQLSVDYRDFEMIERLKLSSSLPREYRIYLQKSLGPGAVQYRDPGTTGRAFPSAHQISSSEATVRLKDLVATIELEAQLYDRAQRTPEKYAEPLAAEISSKAAALKRRVAADLYGDGSGALGEISSVSVNSAVANRAVVTLQAANGDIGHAGLFELDEKLIDKTNAGAAGGSPTISAGTFDYWLVTARDRAAGTVTLAPVNTLGNTVNVTAWTVTAGDRLYKNGQPTFPDVSGSITDYGTLSEAMLGLESWTQDDNRTVFGLSMTGAIAGSRYGAGGNPIDAKHFQRALDLVKVNVGQDRYRYKMAVMAPETHAALIESREADRRFHMASDKARGVDGALVFLHGNDKVEMVTSEYCWPKRVYLLPEMKSGKKVLGYVGSGFESVKFPGGSEFYLKPGSSGSYVDMVQSFVRGTGQLICRHPAAIGVINNFTNT